MISSKRFEIRKQIIGVRVAVTWRTTSAWMHCRMTSQNELNGALLPGSACGRRTPDEVRPDDVCGPEAPNTHHVRSVRVASPAARHRFMCVEETKSQGNHDDNETITAWYKRGLRTPRCLSVRDHSFRWRGDIYVGPGDAPVECERNSRNLHSYLEKVYNFADSFKTDLSIAVCLYKRTNMPNVILACFRMTRTQDIFIIQ